MVARDMVREFALSLKAISRNGAVKRPLAALWPFGKHEPARGRGLYLDGGFGVGKTHLLAAAYVSADTPKKRYVSFQELVYLIGVMGMRRAKEELAAADLMLIDEFELDDPGNTLIVKTFLDELLARGGSVVTTSNTPPDAQGQGRFNAEDFQREIQSLAAAFTVVQVGGPDYRHRESLGQWLTGAELAELRTTEAVAGPRLALTWEELFGLLERVHPTRYGGLVAQAGTIYLDGARAITDQASALRFVHFIDKVYDLEVRLRVSGEGPLLELFHASYREGAYAKKHHRCLSRLSELLSSAPAPSQLANS